jgi:hypothetical protein
LAKHLLFDYATQDQFMNILNLISKGSKLYLVTFGDGQEKIAAEGALVAGFARTARRENKNLQFINLNVQDSLEIHCGDVLAMLSRFTASTETKTASGESVELDDMYRHGKVHIPRYIHDHKHADAITPISEEPDKKETLFHQPSRAFKVHVGKPGRLHTLTFIYDEQERLAQLTSKSSLTRED